MEATVTAPATIAGEGRREAVPPPHTACGEGERKSPLPDACELLGTFLQRQLSEGAQNPTASVTVTGNQTDANVAPATPGKRARRKSMSRRSGQNGYIERKGK